MPALDEAAARDDWVRSTAMNNFAAGGAHVTTQVADTINGRQNVTGLVHDGGGWVLPMVPGIANLGGSIYGGAALGASVDLVEAVTGSTVRWATTRFLTAPSVGDPLALDRRADVVGRRTSHLTVVGEVEGILAFETMVVAGAGDTRPEAINGFWRTMPDVPSPHDCPPVQGRERFADYEDYAIGRTERRVALGAHPWSSEPGHGTGRVAFWARLTTGGTSSPAGLAWLADCVGAGVGRAVGPLSRATSLDNTIRYAQPAESEWVLVDVHAAAAHDGYGYGEVDLYAEDGTLLATGSQTCIVRLAERPEEGF